MEEVIFRDPHGNKVISIGKREDGSIYTSIESGSDLISIEEKELNMINREIKRLRRKK